MPPYAIMYAAMVLLPGMLQTLFGYNATWSGLVMSPAGLFSIPTIVLSGYLVGKRIDARWLIIAGACLMAAGSYWYSQMNLEVGPGQLIWPRVLAAGRDRRPVRSAERGRVPVLAHGAAGPGRGHLRRPAQGGRQPRHHAGQDDRRRAGCRCTPAASASTSTCTAPRFNEAARSAQAYFYHLTGDPQGSQTMALKAIDSLRQQQAAAMAYLDAYWLFAVLALVIIPLALFMRKSLAEEGVHISAH